MATDSVTTSKPLKTLEQQPPEAETSPNKRLKTLNIISPSSKGKSKLEEPVLEFKEHGRKQDDDDDDDLPSPSSLDSDSNCCGICLLEEGKSIRGFIDCCDHHFCFVCIMEWAKVESRCPMCKRRFSTIRRPPKDGVFRSERLVNVPVRDQVNKYVKDLTNHPKIPGPLVALLPKATTTTFHSINNLVYHYLGITTISHSDPYAEIQCCVCHCTSDESLLLLCDLCDSAAHTYCVGLGVTVPEGDWFCQDCTVSRADHASSETDTGLTDQNMAGKSYAVTSAEANVSIFDVIRDSSIPYVESPRTIASLHPNRLSSPAHEASDSGARTMQKVADRASKSNARTLSRCRNVHGHIRALRANWNALRGGYLSFSSSSVNSGGNNRRRKLNIGAVPSNRSGQPHSSSSPTCQQLAAQVGCSGDTSYSRNSQDVEKAWKMMDIAKSLHQDRKRTIIVHQPSNLAQGNAPRELSNIKSNFHVSRSQPIITRELGSFSKHDGCSLEMEIEKHKSQKYEKQKQCRVLAEGALKISESLPTTHLGKHFEIPLPRKVRNFVPNETCSGNGASSNVVDEKDSHVCLISPVGSRLESSSAKPDSRASSSCKVDVPQKKCMMENGNAQSKTRKIDNGKIEIQSLVKLNLKLLNKSKQLGVDEFKEVARRSTHSIMVACGLEPPKSGFPSFPSSVCHHSEHNQQLRKSTLMPSSCRECFYVFVKDVVNFILSEKVGHVHG